MWLIKQEEEQILKINFPFYELKILLNALKFYVFIFFMNKRKKIKCRFTKQLYAKRNDQI
jgi:hypothetical protein